MKISKQLGWMIGLGLLSFTLVGLGMGSARHDAQAAGDEAPLCGPAAAPASLQATDVAEAARGVGTGGAAGAGPPLNGGAVRAVPLAAASPKPKPPTSTALVFLPLWARQ